MRGASRGPGEAGWGAGGRSTEGRSAARPAERAAPLAPAEREAGAGGSAGSPSPTDSLGRRGTSSPVPNLDLHLPPDSPSRKCGSNLEESEAGTEKAPEPVASLRFPALTATHPAPS